MSLPELAAAIRVADIRLANDGDLGSLVTSRVRAGRSSGGDGQKSGDDEL